MDRISLLSDDLILKILSFAPTKVAITTSLLSKRWTCLWKLVRTLDYCDPREQSEYWRASRFIDKFLLLRNGGDLDTLNLLVSSHCLPTDIETWVRFAVSHRVQKLQVRYFYQYIHMSSSKPIRLPRSLYTCETLVNLSLQGAVIADVPLTICFRSLKVLLLSSVDFKTGEIVHRLLSGCPVLKELTVIRSSMDHAKTFTIPVPSLEKLTVANLLYRSYTSKVDDFGFVIQAPSLKSLMTVSQFNSFCSLENAPKLIKASIKLLDGDSKKLLGSLTSAKHLSLCVKPPMNSYPIGVFTQLVSLKLCTCSSDWCLVMLRNTPKLRVLTFKLQVTVLQNMVNHHKCCNPHGDFQIQWEQTVPECLISSLETVEWIDYRGTEAQKKVAMYLLANSGQLKTMSIKSFACSLQDKHTMLQGLASTQRASVKCRLSFI